MKLRRIAMTNARRFLAQEAVIDDIGDGINVISAPNEFGKSTFFDALHALFFRPYGTRHRDVASLQPDPGGGAVSVAADIDTGKGLFRIEKRFLNRPMARITTLPGGQIIAQDDEAENWIANLFGQNVPGPAGLLWVRQGVTTLDHADKAERDRLLVTRRDLMSSVAGEIDLMTGGRRMDRIMAAIDAALGEQMTTGGKPRTGGTLKAALDAAETLDGEARVLAEKAALLARAIDERRRVEAEIARLSDPALGAGRIAARDAARAALHRAEAHAADLAAARQKAEIAGFQAQSAAEALAGFTAAMAATVAADTAAAAAVAAFRDLAGRLDHARGDEAAAKAALGTASADVAGLTTARDAARRQSDAATARDKLTRITADLAQAEAQLRALTEAEAILATTAVTPEAIDALDKALAALATAKAALAARSVTVTLDYSGELRVLRDGAAMPAGISALQGRMALDLPGIGRMVIDPGAGDDRETAAGAARAALRLEQALAACGADTPEAARAALHRRHEAEAQLRLARGVLGALAPDGIAALRAQAARVRALADTVGDAAPADIDALEHALAAAAQAESQARAALDAARSAVLGLTGQTGSAQATAELAALGRDRATAAAGYRAERPARLAGLRAAAAETASAAAAGRDAAAALAATAPDLATMRADATRTESAVTAAERTLQQLDVERATLEGAILTQADLALTETLAEVEGRRDAARARAARIWEDVQALQRLRTVLDATRATAREAYFGPVQRELGPLLAILHADAALDFDPDSLLPGRLSRAGAIDSLERLSGGAQEQIAILTRLAFARLYAGDGRPVPVILDDALVHTDDDRIVRMFTALHRVAADQQVIVFTCRQRAFDALGGHRPRVTVRPVT